MTSGQVHLLWHDVAENKHEYLDADDNMTPYLKLNHLSDKSAGAERDLHIYSAICRHQPLLRLNHKGSTGLHHDDFILKVIGHIACQADMLGVRLTHCAFAKAYAPGESGLVHHWVAMNGDEQILTLYIKETILYSGNSGSGWLCMDQLCRYHLLHSNKISQNQSGSLM